MIYGNRSRLKSVFKKGREVTRALSTEEIAQILDWRKELCDIIPEMRSVVKRTLCLPLAVRVPVAIILGALVWINQELDPTFAHLSPGTPCEEPSGPFFTTEATSGGTDPRLKSNGPTGIIIVPGPVTHLTFLFWVAKGDDDIRIIWDSSGNGVNATIWTPSFGIPSMRTLTCYIIAGTHMGDFDIGECWHNFFVHLRDRGLFGVELPTESQKIWGRRWFRWE